MILAFVVALVCVLCDIAGKYAAVTCLGVGESVPVIKGVLNFTYVENRGMAFGMLAEHREIFMVLSSLLIAVIVVFLFIMRKSCGKFLKITCGLILGGGIGNMIDRFRLGYVIDFIDVRLFGRLWTWVFNIADMCVCIGVFMLAVYLLADSRKSRRTAETQNEEERADDGR